MENQDFLLPEDVLAEVLRRLPPHFLATSRCICKAWRSIIDARHLLRADLLPHSVCSIIIQFNELVLSEFFSRPSTGPIVSGNLNSLPLTSIVKDHCNGLLLLEGTTTISVVNPATVTTAISVVNPATRWWAQLPPCPCMGMDFFNADKYLVFDPTLSPHYEVFVILRPATLDPDSQLDPIVEESEWPPSLYIIHVFSSKTKQWEERSFVREGEAVETIASMRPAWDYYNPCRAVYWRGALYVNCQNEFVMRLSLSNNKYQVIKTPTEWNFYLGRSEKGVYCASANDDDQVQVWILSESYGQTEWVFKHSIFLGQVPLEESDGPWILQNINYYERSYYEHDKREAIMEQKIEWDSDNDNVIDLEGRADDRYVCYLEVLGFHPYKEVVFLNDSLKRGLAYHLNTSKIQDLGNILPKDYGTEYSVHTFIETAFPYTPCWMEEFPE